MELNFAERKSPWTKQYAGKPILITLLPLPDLASSMSFLVIKPSETIFSPTRWHSLNKASNSYTIHEQYYLVHTIKLKNMITFKEDKNDNWSHIDTRYYKEYLKWFQLSKVVLHWSCARRSLSEGARSWDGIWIRCSLWWINFFAKLRSTIRDQLHKNIT